MYTPLRYADIAHDSYVDGPGKRTVIFFQGCSIRCKGCQNKHLWPADGGKIEDAKIVAERMVEPGLNAFTISGGEPFDQPLAVSRLITWLRILSPDCHIIVYSGYTLEQLLELGRFPCPDNLSVVATLMRANVLVDGPYVKELDDTSMQYRGSRNQRVIDLHTTIFDTDYLEEGGEPVTLDWDMSEFILTDEGDLLAASPIAEEWVKDIGTLKKTRRCGQTGKE